jgi:hypothetical protein
MCQICTPMSEAARRRRGLGLLVFQDGEEREEVRREAGEVKEAAQPPSPPRVLVFFFFPLGSPFLFCS